MVYSLANYTMRTREAWTIGPAADGWRCSGGRFCAAGLAFVFWDIRGGHFCDGGRIRAPEPPAFPEKGAMPYLTVKSTPMRLTILCEPPLSPGYPSPRQRLHRWTCGIEETQVTFPGRGSIAKDARTS